MIKTKTVFVLGAGASMPYDFESAGTMLVECKKMSPYNIAMAVGFPKVSPPIDTFSEDLRASQNESLDAYLEQRTDSDADMHIGKRLIASRLLLQEYKSNKKFEVTGDWISYLYSRMVYETGSVREFQEKNAVTFVTYNYDRLLEHRISRALQSQFKAPITECMAVFDKIKVIHLHGSLGPLNPPKAIAFGLDATNDRDFASRLSFALETSAHSIQIVHQARPDTAEFLASRAALSETTRVFFLGFGFGQTNVQRLDLRNINQGAQIFLTRKNMTNQEYAHYADGPLRTNGYANINHTDEKWDCYQLLRQQVLNLVT